MTNQGRRVVTGHDSHGKSIVLSDGPSPMVYVTPLRPGFVSVDMFRTFDSPAAITAQTPETTSGPRRQLPAERGSVIRVNVFPPESDATRIDSASAAQIFESLGNSAGHTGAASSRHPMMHRTETIDYAIVLSGEITLILDDSDVLLRSGDVLVQCGTNHAWANRSGAPATVVFVLISGAFDHDLSRLLREPQASA